MRKKKFRYSLTGAVNKIALTGMPSLLCQEVPMTCRRQVIYAVHAIGVEFSPSYLPDGPCDVIWWRGLCVL